MDTEDKGEMSTSSTLSLQGHRTGIDGSMFHSLSPEFRVKVLTCSLKESSLHI